MSRIRRGTRADCNQKEIVLEFLWINLITYALRSFVAGMYATVKGIGEAYNAGSKFAIPDDARVTLTLLAVESRLVASRT